VESRLVPVNKPGGGVRPIALTEVFTKLAGKVLLHLNSEAIRAVFSPIQFGVGISAGIEKVVHAVNASTALRPENDVVLLDFRNAFNKVSRAHALRETHRLFPQLYNYFLACYGAPSNMWLGSGDHNFEVVKSVTGARQGDSLGPLFFCIGIHQILVDLSNQFPECRLLA